MKPKRVYYDFIKVQFIMDFIQRAQFPKALLNPNLSLVKKLKLQCPWKIGSDKEFESEICNSLKSYPHLKQLTLICNETPYLKSFNELGCVIKIEIPND